MDKRKCGGDEIPLLGFGLMRLPRKQGKTFDIDHEASAELIENAMSNGVNYFDTAYTYGGSEEFAGRALSAYSRGSYYLASKCPPWMVNGAGDFERIFAEQQSRCKTDYFDFYLVHNFAQESKRAAGNTEYFERFKKIGMYDMLKRKKSEGKIRRIGFSFHGTLDILKKTVDNYEWDFAQIQLNYVDWKVTNARSQYELLAKKNIPVVVMEPLRGGALAVLNEEASAVLKAARPEDSVASWGLRYAASLPGVITVLSGMNSMQQLQENIGTLSGLVPVSEQEKNTLDEAAAIYSKSGTIACTGCGYCRPCPGGVDIPRVFSIYNHAKLVGFHIPFDNGYSTLEEKEKASNCVQCGLCMEKCPQHLAIPEYLREVEKYASSQGNRL